MKSVQLFLICFLSFISSSGYAENYFRPGTVWTNVFSPDLPYVEDSIFYYTILDEVTFEGEKVLPFVSYSEEYPEEKIKMYLRTDGEKVFWRETEPGRSDWYLLYDFGLKADEEVVIYSEHNEKVISVEMKCLRRDYYLNDNALQGPMMRMQTLKYDARDFTDIDNQGDWIIGIGSAEEMLSPGMFGWIGGGIRILCVESPKGKVVYQREGYEAGVNKIEDSAFSVSTDVYTLQGIRVNRSLNEVPAGIYIVNGKKVIRK